MPNDSARGRCALLAFAALVLAPLPPAAPPFAAPERRAEADVAELAERVVRLGDGAPLEDVLRLGEARSEPAARALSRAYDGMASVASRRAVVRALGLFHGSGAAEEIALGRLVEIATSSGEERIRHDAVAALGAEPTGRPYLRRLVESPAEDALRILALERHVSRAGPEDLEWYEELYVTGSGREDETASERRRRRRRAEAEEAQAPKRLVHALPELRAIAFEALAPELSESEVREATEDPHHEVREAALRALEGVDPRAAGRRAEDLVGRLDERVDVRAVAAGVLVRTRGSRATGELLDLGTALTTPEELRATIAELLARSAQGATRRRITRMLGSPRASSHERLFALHALPEDEDPDVGEGLLDELEEDDPATRVLAAELLGERRVAEAKGPLRELLADEHKPVELRAAAIEALSRIRAGDAAWEAELAEFLGSETRELRNAALRLLPRSAAHAESFAGLLDHPDWSTRYQAFRALVDMRAKEAVPLLIERLAVETGRMREELARALFELTAQPFGDAAPNWERWWDGAAGDFEIETPEEVEAARRRLAERAEREQTRSEFFGIEVVSHRVVFVIDVSGSMNETLRPRFLGDREGATRLDVAKEEIRSAIEGVHPDAHINVIAFSSGVMPWRERGLGPAGPEEREELLEWVSQLGAFGGTNLYDALRAAFSDPKTDTVFVLSDGEPSTGEVVDPFLVRQHVRRWNEHRGVVVHTVAVGSSIDVLEWIARDSGGDHRFRR